MPAMMATLRLTRSMRLAQYNALTVTMRRQSMRRLLRRSSMSPCSPWSTSTGLSLSCLSIVCDAWDGDARGRFVDSSWFEAVTRPWAPGRAGFPGIYRRLPLLIYLAFSSNFPWESAALLFFDMSVCLMSGRREAASVVSKVVFTSLSLPGTWTCSGAKQPPTQHPVLRDATLEGPSFWLQASPARDSAWVPSLGYQTLLRPSFPAPSSPRHIRLHRGDLFRRHQAKPVYEPAALPQEALVEAPPKDAVQGPRLARRVREPQVSRSSPSCGAYASTAPATRRGGPAR